MVTISLMGQLQAADGERDLACELAAPMTVRQLIQRQGVQLRHLLLAEAVDVHRAARDEVLEQLPAALGALEVRALGEHLALGVFVQVRGRGDAFYRMGIGLEGEDSTLAQNQRAKEMFQTAINHLQGACGEYQGYAQGLISNANQYIVRVDAIIRNLSSTSG